MDGISVNFLRLMIQSWKECSMLVLRHIQTREWKSSSVCCPNTRRCCQRSPIARKPAGSVQWILCNSSRWLRQVTVYYHLKQNLVAKKDITAVLSNAYRLGEKLMVDFASDNLSYVDPDTGEIINIGAFVAACLTAAIPMWYAYLCRRQRTFCMP